MVVRAYVTGTTSTSIWTHYEQRRARLLRAPAPRRPQEEPEAPRAHPHADDQGAEGRARRVAARARRSSRRGKVTAKDFDAAAEHRAAALRRRAEDVRRARAHPGRHQVRVRRDARTALVVIDEIHTPDSSRFWKAATYDERFARGQDPEPLDKDFVRRCTSRRATGATARRRRCPTTCASARPSATSRRTSAITGEAFVPDLEPPLARIAKNLGLGGTR